MKYLILIPARYQSSRFPGKPLAKIGDKEMIVRVCERVAETGIEFAVATDSSQIAECVKANGFRVVMTSEECGSGTERVAEAYVSMCTDADVVINVQGDEPFISPRQIDLLVDIFEKYPDTEIATLVRPYDATSGIEGLEDPNLVKVVTGEHGEALYFSRNVVPYLRGVERSEWPVKHDYLSHIGIYAYRGDVLRKIVQLPETSLEKAEKLEQLRWLQSGYDIRTAVSDEPTIGIDTPEDLAAAQIYAEKMESVKNMENQN